MNEILIAKNHIINPSEMENFQCAICYSKETDIVRCKGPCKNVFCLHCVTRFKVKSNQCPNRCSNPWQIEIIPNQFILFKCPYSQECKQTLRGTAQFSQHTQRCEYIPKYISQDIQNKRSFVCPKNHQLLFLNQNIFQQIYKSGNFYTITMNEICNLCNSQTMCTAICKECSTSQKKYVYCIKCRPLPCTRTQCPIGHAYQERNQVLQSTVCDFCGLAISIFGTKSFRDQNCNFDICQCCHNRLPQKHPLVPLKQGTTNNKVGIIAQMLNMFRRANHS